MLIKGGVPSSLAILSRLDETKTVGSVLAQL
jgi:hypothetical protein